MFKIPRYWLTGEEKKLLWKLRAQKSRSDSGDNWRHLIPRTEKELDFMLDMIPADAIEECRSNESFSWEERQSKILPDGTKEIRTIIYEANLKSSLWYFKPLQPFTIHSLPDGIPSNHYESREWIPQVFDISNNIWRNASEWECDHWNDLVNCTSCNHPTIPQFNCNVCGDPLSPPLKETEKRVLSLICIIPDTPDFMTTEEEWETEEEEEIEEETSELEEVVEEEVSEEVKEKEEDEETQNIENS